MVAAGTPCLTRDLTGSLPRCLIPCRLTCRRLSASLSFLTLLRDRVDVIRQVGDIWMGRWEVVMIDLRLLRPHWVEVSNVCLFHHLFCAMRCSSWINGRRSIPVGAMGPA